MTKNYKGQVLPAPASRVIEEEAWCTLHRVNSLLQLSMSVDWDSPMHGAREGQMVLMDEAVQALEHVMAQLSKSNQEEGSINQTQIITSGREQSS